MCTCQLQSLWIQSRFPLQSSSYSFIGNFECWLVDLAGIKEIKIQVQNMHLSAPVAWNSKSYFFDFQNISVVWTRTLVLINIFPSVKITKLLPMEINSWVLRWVVEDYEIYIILLYTGSVFAWYSLQDIWKWRNEEHGGELQIEGVHGKETFKTESIRKLSNFTFQLTKTLYQNNFTHTVILDPFLHFLRAINVISYKK